MKERTAKLEARYKTNRDEMNTEKALAEELQQVSVVRSPVLSVMGGECLLPLLVSALLLAKRGTRCLARSMSTTISIDVRRRLSTEWAQRLRVGPALSLQVAFWAAGGQLLGGRTGHGGPEEADVRQRGRRGAHEGSPDNCPQLEASRGLTGACMHAEDYGRLVPSERSEGAFLRLGDTRFDTR